MPTKVGRKGEAGGGGNLHINHILPWLHPSFGIVLIQEVSHEPELGHSETRSRTKQMARDAQLQLQLQTQENRTANQPASRSQPVSLHCDLISYTTRLESSRNDIEREREREGEGRRNNKRQIRSFIFHRNIPLPLSSSFDNKQEADNTDPR